MAQTSQYTIKYTEQCIRLETLDWLENVQCIELWFGEEKTPQDINV